MTNSSTSKSSKSGGATKRKPIPVTGLSGRHEDLHEMLSFEDPKEQRSWIFDATFMRSSWKCIFGEGCQGILDKPTPELNQGCCSEGAHFVDEDDGIMTLTDHGLCLENNDGVWVSDNFDGDMLAEISELWAISLKFSI